MDLVDQLPQANDPGCECDGDYSRGTNPVTHDSHPQLSIERTSERTGLENGGARPVLRDKSSVATDSNDKTSTGCKDGTTSILHYPPMIFSLEEIVASSYYHELANTAKTRNIDFFASVCRHDVGDRLSCLKKHFAKLSTEATNGSKGYSFGRVLYLTMLWEEGTTYINSLSDQQTKEELCQCSCCDGVCSSGTDGKAHLLKQLKVVAQSAINHVVSQLNSNSLDILNALAGDEEAVLISSNVEEYEEGTN